MFSKSCKYGIRAVLYLAVKTRDGSKKGVQGIADELDVPKHFLAKILQELSRKGLISSIKGPHGGFYMDAKNVQKPLIAVIESIDGPEVMRSCILGLPVCSDKNPCPLHSKARVYRDGLLELVAEQSIAELAKSVEVQNLKI